MSAEHGVTDLQAAAIGWLEDAGVDDRVDGPIVPAAKAPHSDADAIVAVGGRYLESGRDNRLDERSFILRVLVAGSADYVDGPDGSILDLSETKDAAVDALTVHRDGWRATGVSDDVGIDWSDTLDRYLGAVQLGYERTETHATYD